MDASLWSLVGEERILHHLNHGPTLLIWISGRSSRDPSIGVHPDYSVSGNQTEVLASRLLLKDCVVDIANKDRDLLFFLGNQLSLFNKHFHTTVEPKQLNNSHHSHLTNQLDKTQRRKNQESQQHSSIFDSLSQQQQSLLRTAQLLEQRCPRPSARFPNVASAYISSWLAIVIVCL